MSTYFLAAPDAVPSPPVSVPREATPTLTLESMDGSKRLPLNQTIGWKALAGVTGLDMPPIETITSAVPGVYGSVKQGMRVEERQVFIPLKVTAPDRRFSTHRALVQELMQLVDPLRGEFRIVGATGHGERQLTVTYLDGLQGNYGTDQFGMYWRMLGLVAVATQPFAEARTDRLVTFQQSSGGGAFLGTAGGTDAPWPRALSSSSLIGDGMEVRVASEVPVYPTLELTGPMDSFEGTLSPVVTDSAGTVTTVQSSSAWHVSVPNGVPAGSSLRLVTDPRARSIRMDGNLAAGRVARGSTLRPFFPGLNVLDVSAPGGSAATRVRLSWRELYRSLW